MVDFQNPVTGEQWMRWMERRMNWIERHRHNDPGDSTDITPPDPVTAGGGGGGGGGTTPTLAHRHVQVSAATTWTITHGLSFYPNVAAVDSSGTEIYPGTVSYPSSSQVVLTFSAAVAGEAYCS